MMSWGYISFWREDHRVVLPRPITACQGTAVNVTQHCWQRPACPAPPLCSPASPGLRQEGLHVHGPPLWREVNFESNQQRFFCSGFFCSQPTFCLSPSLSHLLLSLKIFALILWHTEHILVTLLLITSSLLQVSSTTAGLLPCLLCYRWHLAIAKWPTHSFNWIPDTRNVTTLCHRVQSSSHCPFKGCTLSSEGRDQKLILSGLSLSSFTPRSGQLSLGPIQLHPPAAKLFWGAGQALLSEPRLYRRSCEDWMAKSGPGWA